MASKTGKKKKVQKKTCQFCRNQKDVSNFFVSYNELHVDGRVPFCKQCIKNFVYTPEGDFDLGQFKSLLQQIDRPFIIEFFESSLDDESDTIGVYFRILNCRQNRHLRWKDSRFGDNEEFNAVDVPENILICPDQKVKRQLIEKWGEGYSTAEYHAFERKFNTLKSSYPLQTKLHEEALLTYIRYKVKEEFAIANNQIKDAKEWGKLAQEAGKNAKINPNQLSKADLQGGLDGFGQLAREVEKAVDIIPILPKFIEKPKDKVDFNIWCYINYVRDLKGLPPVDYEEVYKFYELRKKDMKTNGGLWDDELEANQHKRKGVVNG